MYRGEYETSFFGVPLSDKALITIRLNDILEK